MIQLNVTCLIWHLTLKPTNRVLRFSSFLGLLQLTKYCNIGIYKAKVSIRIYISESEAVPNFRSGEDQLRIPIDVRINRAL